MAHLWRGVLSQFPPIHHQRQQRVMMLAGDEPTEDMSRTKAIGFRTLCRAKLADGFASLCRGLVADISRQLLTLVIFHEATVT
ncbi:hypothetical protein CDEST_01995 [Colletotrichum destructivum]|uniref:Uncharacterized protein n=1 Tax=Colletotrichum destructivum TaxID=34406 RepID=A0AAX4I1A2_9PEZI|nr:hypothetical protein CDEST_01995 [Colletotrichum destructivum]